MFFFFFFFRFSCFFFFTFLRRFFAFLLLSQRTKSNDCNLLQKWRISLQPRLHRPRAKLPGFLEDEMGPPLLIRGLSASRSLSPNLTQTHKSTLSLVLPLLLPTIQSQGSAEIFPKKHRLLGNHFATPTPTQGKNMNKNMDAQLPNLLCFEAFGARLCPDFCADFCLVCGGGGGRGGGEGSLAYF